MLWTEMQGNAWIYVQNLPWSHVNEWEGIILDFEGTIPDCKNRWWEREEKQGKRREQGVRFWNNFPKMSWAFQLSPALEQDVIILIWEGKIKLKVPKAINLVETWKQMLQYILANPFFPNVPASPICIPDFKTLEELGKDYLHEPLSINHQH